MIAPSQSLCSHIHETFGVCVLARAQTRMTRRNNRLSPEDMSSSKRKGCRILNIWVMESSGMGGIPPAWFAYHAPFSLVLSKATQSGDCMCSLNSIVFLLPANVGFITFTASISWTMATAKLAILAAKAPTSAFILGELGLGPIKYYLINWFGALGYPLVRITTIKTCVNVVVLRNIPFCRYVQCIKHIISLLAQLLNTTQTR
jgi:hypothetical protein